MAERLNILNNRTPHLESQHDLTLTVIANQKCQVLCKKEMSVSWW
jgi:hypothetical protein